MYFCQSLIAHTDAGGLEVKLFRPRCIAAARSAALGVFATAGGKKGDDLYLLIERPVRRCSSSPTHPPEGKGGRLYMYFCQSLIAHIEKALKQSLTRPIY